MKTSPTSKRSKTSKRSRSPKTKRRTVAVKNTRKTVAVKNPPKTLEVEFSITPQAYLADTHALVAIEPFEKDAVTEWKTTFTDPIDIQTIQDIKLTAGRILYNLNYNEFAVITEHAPEWIMDWNGPFLLTIKTKDREPVRSTLLRSKLDKYRTHNVY